MLFVWKVHRWENGAAEIISLPYFEYMEWNGGDVLCEKTFWCNKILMVMSQSVEFIDY